MFKNFEEYKEHMEEWYLDYFRPLSDEEIKAMEFYAKYAEFVCDTWTWHYDKEAYEFMDEYNYLVERINEQTRLNFCTGAVIPN